ncbi:amino acid/amide ABC transporter ATP-binding protein 2, HAAT family [Albimonas donghaensis]|uniref:Amino acid/amide ABC transporter ATP-binding protein 2, HAAT family n=1 Tax=Albimonas donghaensis TaxID=356660 RepID=A0A1H2U1R4_9RHOB|nr:ABC transporter ATP-binding protein [Albimonas donghaensis]MAS44983.1 ABC transporter ATP-binding protein [Paracoccaceae bacterium]SDW49334.1 amino acid/amide ABC transporter ATP-binding protein 2, HAAT family [Albimonas donghaensis]|tara:strand:+ start:549 stop:1262 length:714 start_codon:yes stop_codon:yes gene_type:complete
MSNILEVRGLEASYGDLTVLRGIDFDIADGGVTTLLGANGAGKTTTLRAICGMIRRKGEITFEGKRIDRMSTENIVRLGVAQVPEGRGTFTTLTVEENLQLGAMTRPNDKSIHEDIEKSFHFFPRLKERRTQQAGTLSGGEQQMLAIARALMLRPKLMLLDEPSFGLAPLITKQIFEILADVKREAGVSMLIVEQNASLALGIADHAYLIETGSIVMSGEAKAIREDESVRASYLGY